jgi:hypothetical protein
MVACLRWLFACVLVIGAAGLALVARGSASAATTTAASCPTGGLGDRLHPQLGIPGVKVRSSETHLIVARGLVSYTAQTRLNLTATRPLRCAALDYAHGRVLGAEADGRATTWTLRPGKVIVRLGRTVGRGTRFDVVVRTHTEVPSAASLPHSPRDFPPGVFRDGGIMQEIGEPTRAHYLVPMADYPAQKAPWRVVVDVPQGMTLAFSGRTIGVRRLADGRRRFVAASDGPVVPDILQLAVGRLRLVRGPTVDGVQLRSYLPPSAVASSRRALALLPGEIRTMTRLLGPFPFPRYGLLATPHGGDLEDQTLTLVSVAELRNLNVTGPVLFHELVHEWFGDSVSEARWSDLWLAEGHAVYYTSVYAYGADRKSWEADDRSVRRLLRKDGPIAAPRLSAFPDRALAPYGLVPYNGGALALYALRTRVGEARFQQIERAFVKRYHDRAASTQDYLRVVEQLAGTKTRTWFSHWLYRVNPPALPPG